MKSALVDINVALDLILNRQPWEADASAIWDAQDHGHLDGWLASFSLPTIYYVVRRQTDKAAALNAVDRCLSVWNIATTKESTLLLARTLPLADFEDCLQVACAIESSVDAFITRDGSGFGGAGIPVISSADAARMIAGLSGP
jgi:predicted nucleic acid-binding protein